jgi:ArsR family transcriptional regulator
MTLTNDIVRVGKALGDPTRVRLLASLAERELCVCELVDLVDAGQPAVSRHLRILREAGMVEDVRDGKFVNYRLRHPAATPFGEAALAELLRRLPTDAMLEELSQRALVVDRGCF